MKTRDVRGLVGEYRPEYGACEAYLHLKCRFDDNWMT